MNNFKAGELNSPILVTGGLGFIGSQLVERLLSKNFEIHVLDKSSGQNNEYLDQWKKNSNFKHFQIDLLEHNLLENLPNYKIIFHLAANPDVRIGTDDPELIFKNNVIGTFNLLENIRNKPPEILIFTSTSTVYGDAKKIPTNENYTPLNPISIYGASKLACEALISSYANNYSFKAINCRLANIIGPTSTHGVIFDFVKKLKNDQTKLEVLGDGNQDKSYLFVSDCLDAMEVAINNAKNQIEVFNIGSEDSIKVIDIAKLLIKKMGLKTKFVTTGGVDGGRGWKGDVKTMLLDIGKLKSLGWKVKHNSFESIQLTINPIIKK